MSDIRNESEYQWIKLHYGDKKAKRSGVLMMNHIDEGLRILEQINASIIAKRAYCIHPIFQEDEDLKNLDIENTFYREISSQSIVAVMEYRGVANDYLSTRAIDKIEEIKLSPLKDVNDMLIADKVQNYKDFELYHINTHRRSAELNQYFKNWLIRLGVSQNKYIEWKDLLIKGD